MKNYTEKQLAEALGISLLFARVLRKKGFNEPEECLKFLYPTFTDIAETYKEFPDMTIAVQRIKHAIDTDEPICIFGDYDVDGITSTVCLLETLKLLGANPEYHIPDRAKEGYGLNANSIMKLCRDISPLLITVDCGITSVQEIDLARKLGSDVIVVDHHQEKTDKPNAIAFITPPLKLKTDFAGVGLTFKLIQGLVADLPDKRDFLYSLLDLVALGTVIDIASLTGENRSLTSLGLQVLNKTKRPGLQELLKKANCENDVTGFDFAFGIGPRLNAAGRMAHANIATELLLCRDREIGSEIAEKLDDLNMQRRKITTDFVSYAKKQVDKESPVIVIFCPLSSDFGGLTGIAGIVASRLCEQYGKPAIVLVETEKGVLKGSGRCSDSFSLIEALEYSKDTLKHFGGHHVAAGLSVYYKDLEAFKEKFAEYINKTPAKPAKEKRKFAVDVKLSELTEQLYDEIKALEPVGAKNTRPLWKTQVKIIADPSTVGKKQNHLVLRVSDGTATYRCIGWRMGKKIESLEKGQTIDIAYELTIDRWQNRNTLQIVLKEILI